MATAPDDEVYRDDPGGEGVVLGRQVEAGHDLRQGREGHRLDVHDEDGYRCEDNQHEHGVVHGPVLGFLLLFASPVHLTRLNDVALITLVPNPSTIK